MENNIPKGRCFLTFLICVGVIWTLIALSMKVVPIQYAMTEDGQMNLIPKTRRLLATLTGGYQVGDIRDTNSSIIERTGQFIRNAVSRNSTGITSHVKSSYEVVDAINREEGAYLQIHITARDDLGQQRQGGGDFWTATLSAVSGQHSTAGRIVDHENGTYSVYFISAWKEESDVNITLIHNSAAVAYMKDYVWPVFRIRYEGYFEDGNTTSQTNCSVASTSEQWDEDKCVYSHPLALGNHLFVCDIPDKGLTCDSMFSYGNNGESGRLQVEVERQILTGNEYLFQDRIYRRVENGPSRIKPQAESKKRSTSTLTTAFILDETREPLSSGYWMGPIWKSLALEKQDQFDDKHRVGECLRNKEMYLVGDSTLTNQIYGQLCNIMNVTGYLDRSRPSTGQVFPALMPTSVHVNEYNLTVVRAFHHIKVGPARDFSFAIFEVDLLDSIGHDGWCDYVIVLGFGIHFRQWSRSAFTARVTHIQDAISRFRERCPRTPIIIKGAHMSEPAHKASTNVMNIAIAYSDWYVHAILNTMKIYLQDYEGVMFLDTWDLNLAFPEPNNTHMSLVAVRQELFMILSLICL